MLLTVTFHLTNPYLFDIHLYEMMIKKKEKEKTIEV